MKLSVQSSCPEAVRYCFILLVSYYQQSKSTLTTPHTQNPFYITFIRRCTNVENIWRQPSELWFLQGWGPLLRKGTYSWPTVHLFTVLGSSDTMRATYIFLSSPHTSAYGFLFITHVCLCLRISWRSALFEVQSQVFRVKGECCCQIYVAANACVIWLIWLYTFNCVTLLPRCSGLCPLSTSSYGSSSLRLFTSLSVE